MSTSRDTTSPVRSPASIEKVSTGVGGLDEALDGGFPKGRPTTISGGAGAGKTVLIFTYLRACLQRGEPVILVSFEERADDLRRHAATLDLDLATAERCGLLAIVDATPKTGPDERGIDMDRVTDDVRTAKDDLNAKHFLVESYDAFTRTIEQMVQERQEYYDLRSWILENDLTTLITVKADEQGNVIPNSYADFLMYWSDCHLQLEYCFEGHAGVRRLWVRKYRGSGFRTGRHMFHIGRAGVRLAPLVALDLPEGTSQGLVSTGSETLDELCGGGLPAGSTTVLTGPSGSGKTILTAMISMAAYRRGDRLLRLDLETATTTLFRFMHRAGLDLKAAQQENMSKSIAVLPEAINAEELLLRVTDLMDSFEPGILVFESLSAALRLGSPALAMAFLVRLIGAARVRSITLIATSTRSRSNPRGIHSEVAPMSAMFDCIIDCDAEYQDRSLLRTVAVLKSLECKHSPRVHVFDIEADGLRFQVSPEAG